MLNNIKNLLSRSNFYKSNVILKQILLNKYLQQKILTPVCCSHDQKNYSTAPKSSLLPDGPSLKDFITSELPPIEHTNENIPYLTNTQYGLHRKVYFDIYGCQMNFNDTEIVWSILKNNGYLKTDKLNDADVVLVVTCSIREGAESKIWNKIDYLKGIRATKLRSGNKIPMKIGILGCMAERLKHKMLEKEQAIDLGI